MRRSMKTPFGREQSTRLGMFVMGTPGPGDGRTTGVRPLKNQSEKMFKIIFWN
jgi:hypothetical protein